MKNQQVDYVDSYKYIGIVINKMWSFDDHISYISIKIYKSFHIV